MKAVAHPSGMPLLFDAKWHQYKMGGVALRSVSKVLDQFFPFDEKRVLGIVSKKTGEPEEVIKEKWNRQALLGKNIHEFIEKKILSQPPPTFYLLLEKFKDKPDIPAAMKDMIHGEEFLYLPAAEKAVETVKKDYTVLAVEQVVACPSLGIAGTIDLLAQNKKTGKILIGDWKTSGSIRSDFRFGSFETSSLGCLRHLPNSKMYRYALQIIIYGEILRREKYFESGFFEKHALGGGAVTGGEEGKPMLPHSQDKVIKRTLADGTTPPTSLSGACSSNSSLDPIDLEYGLMHFCKEQTGDVTSEFVGISESTVLPVDRPEMTFTHLLKQVLEGVS